MAKKKEAVKAEYLDGEMTAKKDFEIHQNDYHRVIKEGDDLSDVPECYHQNLKTEGVL